MSAKNPFSVIITRDFNGRSMQWWDGEFENDEGKYLSHSQPTLA